MREAACDLAMRIMLSSSEEEIGVISEYLEELVARERQRAYDIVYCDCSRSDCELKEAAEKIMCVETTK
jgi:hypothetical protein